MKYRDHLAVSTATSDTEAALALLMIHVRCFSSELTWLGYSLLLHVQEHLEARYRDYLRSDRLQP